MGNIKKKLYLISYLVLVTLTFFSIVYAQDIINLSQTGKTKCYDSFSVEINCSGTRQDRDIQTGADLSSPHQASPKFNAGTGSEPDGAKRTRLIGAYGQLPLHFEANQCQVEETVRFLSRGSGYKLFLTSTEAVLSLGRANQGSEKTGREAVNTQADILRMKWEGANQNPEVEGLDRLEGKNHYFIGNDPDQWRTNISLYRKVRYRDLYPGIDLIYYGNQRQLEYDLVVTPKGDPGAIRLLIEGAEGAGVDEGGNLILQVGSGEVIQHAPRIYQEVGGKKQFIEGGYVVDSSGKNGDKNKVLIGFKIDKFDMKRPLIIDPVLAYSTYLGGSSDDAGYGIAVDSSGSAYIIGETSSNNFPTINPIQGSDGGSRDAFVTKLNPDGSELVYSTYLGGSKQDVGYGIAVDGSGSAYITGKTFSNNFPTVNPIQGSLAGDHDAFVTKLNPDGSELVYSTYLGGSGEDYGQAIAVDSSGSAYITGETASTNFPTANPIQGTNAGGYDAFVTKLNPDGSALVYSTYLGGSKQDVGYGIAVDGSGSAYITGYTSFTDFPTANPIQGTNAGGYDAVVTKLNPDGSALVYSTYLGGSEGGDLGYGIAVDSSGSAAITGKTSSNNFPIVNPIQESYGGSSDAFVTKLDPGGSVLVYSTYLGGSDYDYGWGIAVDTSGNIYVTGESSSNNFPTVNPIQGSYGGSSDVFVARLDMTESISTPTTPTGPTSGTKNNSYSYSTGGSTSSLGHSVEYQFDWKGDGTDLSSWGPATQSKTWTVPGMYTVRARARCATDTSEVSNWSSGVPVTIVGFSITAISPNGGENWKAGTTQTVSWSYTGSPGNYLKIELLKGEAVNRTIAYIARIGSGGSGTYSWRIPKFQTQSSDYKIRITSATNSSYTDTSDDNFTISK